MKKQIACVSCIFFLGLASAVYAQESSQVEETTVNQTEADALSETNAVAGAETASSSSKDDMSEETPGFIKRTVNFAKALPLGYDFGCEPTLHGSLTYLNVKYKWSEEKQIFTRILFNYGSTLSLEPSSKNEFSGDSDLKKYEYEEKAIDFKLIPWGKQINSKSSEGRYFTIEPGMNFRIEPEKVNMTFAAFMDDEEVGKMYYTLDMDQDGKRYIIRPYYSTTLSSPLGKLFSISLDLLYAPFYFFWGSNKVDFTANGFGDKEGRAVESIPTLNMKYSGFSENYVDANLVVGLFNLVAASGRLIYERRHKTDFTLTQNFTTAESENKYERLSLKVGGSIINIGKASMRIKAGLFYQWDWEYNHNEESWFHSGKFIFGVGMKNLY